MPSRPSPDVGRKRLAILYHSAAGGTRVVADLLAELVGGQHDARATRIEEAGALEQACRCDFLLLCYPTYFLRPSPSMQEFVERLAPRRGNPPAFLVTTYELYAENSLRACALAMRRKGFLVRGSAAIRAPGSDLTCVIPDWLCTWLYRFQPGFPRRLRAIARQVSALARSGGRRERLPRLKWYTPAAQALQRGFFDGFIEWRRRIRILSDRCSDCGQCVRRCDRGGWTREDGEIRHHPERCELCTRCIHHCPRKAIVLSPLLRDNRRLDACHFRGLEARARRALSLPALSLPAPSAPAPAPSPLLPALPLPAPFPPARFPSPRNGGESA